MKYNGLVSFDADDTLWEFARITFKNIQKFASRNGFKVPSWESYTVAHPHVYKRKFRILWPDEDPETVTIPRYEAFQDKEPYRLIRGANQTVKIIHDNYLVEMLSSRPDEATIRKNAEKIGLNLKPFSYLQTAEDTEYHKPDARVFDPVKERALNQSIKTDKIVHVGDSLSDYNAAFNAGIQFVAVLTGINSRQEFQDEGLPQENIGETIVEIPSIIDRLMLDI